MSTEPRKPVINIVNAMTTIETNINLALSHIRDSRSPLSGPFEERRDEIEKHMLLSKRAFDWLDNHTIINEAS